MANTCNHSRPAEMGLGLCLVLVGAGYFIRGCATPTHGESYYIEKDRISAEARVKIETQRSLAIQELAKQYGGRLSPDDFKKLLDDCKPAVER